MASPLISFTMPGPGVCYAFSSLSFKGHTFYPGRRGPFRVEGPQDGAEPICLEKLRNKYGHSLQCLGEALQGQPLSCRLLIQTRSMWLG